MYDEGHYFGKWDNYVRRLGTSGMIEDEAKEVSRRGWHTPRSSAMSWISIAKVLYSLLDEQNRATGKFMVQDEYSDEEYEALFCADAFVDAREIIASFRMLIPGEYVLVARGRDKLSYNYILQPFTGYLGKKWEWLSAFQIGEGNDIKPGEIINVGPQGSRFLMTADGVVRMSPGDLVTAGLQSETLKQNPLQELYFDPSFGLRISAQYMEYITSAGAKFYGLRTGAHKVPGSPATDPSRVTEIVTDIKNNPLGNFVETMEGNLSTTGTPGGGGTPIYQKNINNKVVIRGWRSGKYEVVSDIQGPQGVAQSAEIITAQAAESPLKQVIDPLAQSHTISGPVVNIDGGTEVSAQSVSLNIESLVTNINSKHAGTGTVNATVSNVLIDAQQITLRCGASSIVITPAGIVITGPSVQVI
jgi:hypothetical protein